MMQKPEEIVSDAEVERVHANANFGSMKKRDVLGIGVLHCAMQFISGYTMTAICVEHGLLRRCGQGTKLTKKGVRYLHSVFAEHMRAIERLVESDAKGGTQ